jgi:hypothetical protein
LKRIAGKEITKDNSQNSNKEQIQKNKSQAHSGASFEANR